MFVQETGQTSKKIASMRILKKIKRKIVCGPKHRRLSSHKNTNGTNNLPPIRFHPIHGENVRLSSNSTRAVRVDSYCKAIVFSNRPIKPEERVYIKLTSVTNTWDGSLKFGFTAINPSTYRNASNLPSYAFPDMTNKNGSWAKHLPERFATRESILSFHFTSDGTIYYAVNGEDKGFFNAGVSGTNLWALIDVYGNTEAIEVIDPRLHVYYSHNIRNQLRSQSLARRSQSMGILPAALSSDDDEENDDGNDDGLYESMGRLKITKREPLPQVYSKVNLHPLSFHRTRGVNVRLSNDRSVAQRVCHYNQGYTFSQRPLQQNEKVVLHVLQTDELYSGSLTFGLTTCDPTTISSTELPEDSHHLLDRPEYWVVIKDVANGPQPGDELAFEISENGRVQMTKNKQAPVTLMHVDATQKFFCFFDLFGSTIKVKLLGSFKPPTPKDKIYAQRQPIRTPCGVRSTCADNLYNQPFYPLDIYGKTNTKAKSCHSIAQMRHPDYAIPIKRTQAAEINRSPHHSTMSRGSSGLSTLAGSHRSSSMSTLANECRVCFESPIDTVLYMCGHMCMCYDCAVKQWKAPGGGQCPICRAHIRDVIRTYKS